jgi:hypothetical protein
MTDLSQIRECSATTRLEGQEALSQPWLTGASPSRVDPFLGALPTEQLDANEDLSPPQSRDENLATVGRWRSHRTDLLAAESILVAALLTYFVVGVAALLVR